MARSGSGGGGRSPATAISVGLSIVAVLVVVLLIAASTTRFAQIDAGERGIILDQGAVQGVQEPGIFIRLFAPFTEVRTVNMRRQTIEIKQNVASKDKQLYDIHIAVDYTRAYTATALMNQYERLGSDDAQLQQVLNGFIQDALKSASTQSTLDQLLSDRGSLAQRVRDGLTRGVEGRPSPQDQLFITIDAVKVLDVEVGAKYRELLEEKANLEVKIETEERRKQQIEAEQGNRLFQAQQEALISLTREEGVTKSSLEIANREREVRRLQAQSFRESPELFELRRQELAVEMLKAGNIWFIDPNTRLTLLLNNMTDGTTTLPIPQAPVAPAPTETP